MFWIGFGTGAYTIIVAEFMALIVLAIKRGRKK